MKIHLLDSQLAQIARHGEEAYPFEGCGILLGRIEEDRKIVVEVLMTDNAREETAQHNRYLIPPEEQLQAEDLAEERGLEVIGFFHSHPDHPARPSDTDLEYGWPGYSYLITTVQGGVAGATRSFTLRQDHSDFDQEQLVIKGRDWGLGICDL